VQALALTGYGDDEIMDIEDARREYRQAVVDLAILWRESGASKDGKVLKAFGLPSFWAVESTVWMASLTSSVVCTILQLLIYLWLFESRWAFGFSLPVALFSFGAIISGFL